MPTTDELLHWAENQAKVLELDMAWYQGAGTAYWKATSRDTESKIRARAIAALEFLDRFAVMTLSGPSGAATWLTAATRCRLVPGRSETSSLSGPLP